MRTVRTLSLALTVGALGCGDAALTTSPSADRRPPSSRGAGPSLAPGSADASSDGEYGSVAFTGETWNDYGDYVFVPDNGSLNGGYMYARSIATGRVVYGEASYDAGYQLRDLDTSQGVEVWAVPVGNCRFWMWENYTTNPNRGVIPQADGATFSARFLCPSS